MLSQRVQDSLQMLTTEVRDKLMKYDAANESCEQMRKQMLQKTALAIEQVNSINDMILIVS
jgi:hypothetical protein